MRNVLTITCDDETNSYQVQIPQGTTLGETAFAVNVLARALAKSGHIDNPRAFTDRVNSYIDDVQYDEVTEEGGNDDGTETVSESNQGTD